MGGKIAVLTTLGFISLAHPALAEENWQAEISKALGKAGTAAPGEVYRVSLPRTDLKATVDGVELKPAFALGSWLGFMAHPSATNVTVMGDLVLTDDEVGPVMKRLLEGGIEVTALHNHLLRNTPHTMYLHVHGRGEPGKLAASLKEGLAQSKTPLGEASPPPPAQTQLNTGLIDQGVGRTGKLLGEIYQFNIARRSAPQEDGMAIPEAMGAAIAINFEADGSGQAAITGDFVLAAAEVNKVAKTLADNGVEVTALHNHMLTEEPRLFFMHFWGHGETVKLAQAIGAALKQADVAGP